MLRDFDYIDLGRIRMPSYTVPVTIKSLVFSEDPQGGRPAQRIHHHDEQDHARSWSSATITGTTITATVTIIITHDATARSRAAIGADRETGRLAPRATRPDEVG